MNVDPCKNGAVVTVTVGSKTHNFIKNDVGALPNAVIEERWNKISRRN